MPINSRQKGARGEREFAELLREHGWPGARRGQQRAGVDGADVIDGPADWHFEVKWVQSLNFWEAYKQSCRDAKPDEEPVVVARRNGTPWLALLSARTFLRLLRAAGANRRSWGKPEAFSRVPERQETSQQQLDELLGL